MTDEERMNHVYMVGDLAICVHAPPKGHDWGDFCLRIGDTIQITDPHSSPSYVAFTAGGRERHIRRTYIEPFAATATMKQCTCPIATLMTSGCTCGGH